MSGDVLLGLLFWLTVLPIVGSVVFVIVALVIGAIKAAFGPSTCKRCGLTGSHARRCPTQVGQL